MTTNLLRSLADFIDRNDLPEPSISIAPSGYCQLHVENLRDVRAWAVAFGHPVTVQYVQGDEQRIAFVSHATAGLINDAAVRVAFHDMDPVRVAARAPQAVTA